MPIFTQKVCDFWGITEKEFFSNPKDRKLSTARQMVWALSKFRNISGLEVTKFMNNKGGVYSYSITDSTVAKGVHAVHIKMEKDSDLRAIFNKLKDESIF